MKPSQESHEKTVERLLDAAGKVLEATYEDEQRTHRAITELERLRTSVEQKISTLSRDTVVLIEGASDTTAKKAAELLQHKFLEADAAAERARARYVQAAQGLGWRLFGLAALMQLLLFVAGWLILGRTLPSEDDIADRRQTVQQLRHQTVDLQGQVADLDRQIKSRQRKVNDLDRRGARVDWTVCKDNAQISHLCFRTDEEAGDFSSANGEKTYRIPWGY